MVRSLAVGIDCELDEFISCCLVDMYSKSQRAGGALKVFATFEDPKVVSWTVIIACLKKKGTAEKQLRCLRE